MRALGLFVSLLIMIMGVLGLFAPDSLMTIAQYSLSSAGLYAAGAFRIGIGLVLIAVAPLSRMPRTLRVLGIVALVGGLATPFVGVERARAVVDWMLAQGPALIRLWAAFALILGLFIAYAVAPRKPA